MLSRDKYAWKERTAQWHLDDIYLTSWVSSALYGLTQVAALRSNVTKAARLGQESAMLFEQIGHYKAEGVREWLLSLPASTS